MRSRNTRALVPVLSKFRFVGVVVALVALASVTRHAVAQDLFVADNNVGNTKRITPGGTVSTFATGFGNPRNLVFGSTGDLFVTDNGTGLVSRIAPGGGVSTYGSGFSNPQGLAFGSGGGLYIADPSNSRIARILSGGGAPLTFCKHQ